MAIWHLSKENEQKIVAFRHERHEHPELSHEEYETSRKIKEFLETIPGVEILKLPQETTGVVARIRGCAAGAENGPEIGLRADIDAIHQSEATGLAWSSKTNGLMHACGHDFHTASLLGAALILSEHRDEFRGAVDLLFQKAEETTDGMQQMMDEGLFEVIHPDYFFGIHNRPEVPVGQIVCNEGPLMAAKTNVSVKIIGFGGHGSMPHLNIDPIVASASAIMSLQTIVSRNTDPLDSVVLTVGYLSAGEPANMVVNEVTMNICIRALRDDSLHKAIERMETILKGTAEAYQCRAQITYEQLLPAVYNKKEMAAKACEAAAQIVGKENVISVDPALASEDFAVMMAKVPSFFYWVGSGRKETVNPAWHNPAFQADDAGMTVAAELLASSVRVMEK